MNRTDELTDRLIDGALTDAEATELESLLAADPAAPSRHLSAVRLELALRGLRTEFAIAEPTVAKIEADRLGRTTAAVMAELARRPIPGRFARRLRLVVASAAAAAAVIVAVLLGLRPPNEPADPGNSPPAPEYARLTSVSGEVEIVGASGVAAGRAGGLLTRDQTLRTVGDDSVAVVEFPDRTRFEIHPDSIVRFASPADESSRKLVLVEGRMTAVATGRLVVVGGSAQVETIHGTFSMSSAGSGAARVESTEGDVRVQRGATAVPVALGPGQATYVPDDATLVSIDTRWRMDSEPLDRLDFAALDVGFDADGSVVAASAKQWSRWTPGTPDPGRTLLLPKVFNDGLASWLTADRRAAAVCRVDDREARITVRDLPSGNERGRIPVRVQEPRFLAVAPDASWVATVGPKPDNRRVRIWDVATGRERFVFDLDNSVTCMAASPDGRRLAVGLFDVTRNSTHSVAVFDPVVGGRVFDFPTRRKGVTALAFSADGRQLAVGFNGAIQLWDVSGRRLVRTLEGFERVVTRLAFSPAGDLLAAGTQDGQVWVWTASTGRRTQVIDTGTRGVRSLAFSADGKLLVTATNRAPVAVWEVASEPADGFEQDT